MEKMLVLQWSSKEFGGFDEVVDFEDALIDAIPEKLGFVDGHDMGSGEVNMFIITDDPMTCFKFALKTATRLGRDVSLRAAYRLLAGSSYEVIWPKGIKDFSVS